MKKTALAVLVLLTAFSLFSAGLTVESADTVAAGKGMVSLGGDMGFYNRFYNNSGDYVEFTGNTAKTSISIPLAVKYGLGNNMEAGLEVPFVLSTFTTAANTKLTGTGFGDAVISGKMGLMKDASMSAAAKLSIGIPLGKSALDASSADFPTASGFLSIGLNVSGSMKLCEGNELSLNAGYTLPLSATVTQVYGITFPETKITPAGVFSYGVSDKHKLMKELSAIIEASGFFKATGSAVFTAGGDATAAVMIAGSPDIVLYNQSAIFVKPALQYALSDSMSVTAGTTITMYMLNDYSALPGNVFVTVGAGF